MNEKVKLCWQGAAELTEGNTWQDQQDFLEHFAKQIVGETVLAILATDCRDFVYTTFDRDRAEGTISRVVDQVRNHWGFE